MNPEPNLHWAFLSRLEAWQDFPETLIHSSDIHEHTTYGKKYTALPVDKRDCHYQYPLEDRSMAWSWDCS